MIRSETFISGEFCCGDGYTGVPLTGLGVHMSRSIKHNTLRGKSDTFSELFELILEHEILIMVPNRATHVEEP